MNDFKEGQEAEALNKLAREQMKTKLYSDIIFDLQVCEIENWDKKQYINELHNLIDEIYLKIK